jgi:hypothetical protein
MKTVAETIPSARPPRWTEEEKIFLTEHLHWDDARIGDALGRSAIGVKIKRQRMWLPPVTKAEGWLTASQAKMMLGMPDQRPIIGWVRAGLLTGNRLENTTRVIWMVLEVSLRRFVANPKNWIYFRKERVQDAHLKRLIELAAIRFQDDWLPARKAGDLIGLDAKEIVRYVKLGRIEGVQVVNRDGRRNLHEQPHWSYWYVRKSQVESMRIYHGRGVLPIFEECASAGDFVRLAYSVGLSAQRIEALTGISHATISNFSKRKIGEVQLADWREYKDRFPYICRAASAYAARRATSDQLYILANILAAQEVMHGLRKRGGSSGRVAHKTIDILRKRLLEHGIEPFLL